MSFIDFLKNQLRQHPCAKPQDAVKLCYQAAFGAEHLLLDAAAAGEYFDNEFSSVDEAEIALFEQISPDFCRVNLAAWKRTSMPSEWLFNMFRATASGGAAANAEAVFQGCLLDVEILLARGDATFSQDEWNSFMDCYDKIEPVPVHHSTTYRDSEHPAYRVVSMRFARLIPLLTRMADMPQSETHIIAVDGRSASGKTTMAEALAEITGGGVIHMDDFFLPGNLRTDERLGEPGGNVHYERFSAEVIPCLSSADAFSYISFDCEKMQMGESRRVKASAWRIVEGAYSCHPKLGDYMDLRVFCDIAADEQQRRIRSRDGEELLAVFSSRWIPMEEHYINTYKTKDNADFLA